MPKQKPFFGEDPPPELNIPGLQFIQEYIAPEQERRLLTAIDQREWITELRRRVQHYGFRYNYKPVQKKIASAPPFPKWASNLATKIVADSFMDEVPDQLIVNEYEPGQGIASHIDQENFFGEKIVSISLGSQIVMNFIHAKTREKVSLLLQPRSLLLLSQEARHDWMHGIPDRLTDICQGDRVKRERRVSLTFRNIKQS